MPTKVAVVQAPPVLLDRAATIDRMLGRMDEVAAAGAGLIVFPEAYVPGYPTWIWRLKPGGDMALAGEIHARRRAWISPASAMSPPGLRRQIQVG